MATVRVGSVWNLQDSFRASVPTKCISRNFDSGDLRSGQCRDLPIISLWGNMKMLPVSRKRTETTQFFQDHSQSTHLWWSGCNWWSGVTGRSYEVTWGHKPFFANNFWLKRDTEAGFVSLCFSRRDASDDMQHDLFWWPWPWPWPWPEVKFWPWPFKVKRYIFWTLSTSWTRWCHFYLRISIIKKVINEKRSRCKTIIFSLMTSGAKTIDLRSNLSEKRYWGLKRATRCFFRIPPSYHTFRDNRECLRKNRDFLKIWPLVTSGDLNIDLT